VLSLLLVPLLQEINRAIQMIRTVDFMIEVLA
jgi:hypothetical protein